MIEVGHAGYLFHIHDSAACNLRNSSSVISCVSTVPSSRVSTTSKPASVTTNSTIEVFIPGATSNDLVNAAPFTSVSIAL